MSPRRYRMTKRAGAAGETRRRILEASLKLHRSKGFRATSWHDIAQDAEVAVGTVYHHFPTFDELVPACSALALERLAPPNPQVLLGIRGKRARIECLIKELFELYERSSDGLQHLFRERDTIPAVARLAEERLAYVRSLVEAALGPSASHEEVGLVESLLDFRVWLALTERGFRREVITELIAHLVGCAIRRK